MITKTYNKIILNITQIIDRHIQMHSQDCVSINKLKKKKSNPHFQNN